MADATATPTSSTAPHGLPHGHDHQAPATPGKVAMWLFLATEVMFFTGLIGTYIVLRSGSPFGSYSHKASPGTDLADVANIPDNPLFHWPKPYDHAVNPLSIDLTAVNTFILICSSVTMVLALSAIQR